MQTGIDAGRRRSGRRDLPLLNAAGQVWLSLATEVSGCENLSYHLSRNRLPMNILRIAWSFVPSHQQDVSCPRCGKQQISAAFLQDWGLLGRDSLKVRSRQLPT